MAGNNLRTPNFSKHRRQWLETGLSRRMTGGGGAIKQAGRTCSSRVSGAGSQNSIISSSTSAWKIALSISASVRGSTCSMAGLGTGIDAVSRIPAASTYFAGFCYTCLLKSVARRTGLESCICVCCCCSECLLVARCRHMQAHPLLLQPAKQT